MGSIGYLRARTSFARLSAAVDALWHYQHVLTPSCCGWMPGSHTGVWPGTWKGWGGSEATARPPSLFSLVGRKGLKPGTPPTQSLPSIMALHCGRGRQNNLWHVSISVCVCACVWFSTCCPCETKRKTSFISPQIWGCRSFSRRFMSFLLSATLLFCCLYFTSDCLLLQDYTNFW